MVTCLRMRVQKANLTVGQVFNYLLGSLARVFTTLQEVDDKLILYSFVAGFALNLVLALQMLYYWNAPSAKARGKKPVPVPAAKPSGASYASVAAPASAAASSSASPKNAGGKGPTTRRRG